MIKRILATTDGSESAAIGIRYAAALATQWDASLLVVHVVDVKLLEGPFLRDLSASLGTAPYVNYQNNIAMLLDERGKAALQHAADLCQEYGAACETELHSGLVPRVIVDKGQLVDLIVMGRSGEHHEFLDGLIGSTTEAVVRNAATPVVVTGCDTPGAAQVLIAYDGSPHARKALKIAATLAAERNRNLRVLVVGEKNGPKWLREAEEYVASYTIEVAFNHETGEPGEQILACAAQSGAGLIVMGAYGHSKLRELVLGSTTSHVINHAPCPVLLVR